MQHLRISSVLTLARPLAGAYSVQNRLMLRNYFAIAWRNLIRSKWYSLINTLGLSIGMAVALLIGQGGRPDQGAMPPQPQQNWTQPAPGNQGPQNQNRGQNRRNNQQQPRNSDGKVCGNCELQGHLTKDCVKVDSNGYVNACPAHNTRRHNLWTC